MLCAMCYNRHMQNKKTAIIIISVLAFIVIAACAIVPGSLYANGLLATAHPLNKAKDGQIRVACVGDSLTYGYGISDWAKNNYPAQMGKLLGDEFCVNNFGFSGRTASFEGDRPYVNEKLYRQSLDFAPEIVVLMLGSNDTKAMNWRGKEAFKDDYKKIIKSYTALDSVRKVFIMSPTPVFLKDGKAPYGINIELVATDVHDVAKELASEMNLFYIDLYKIFEDRQNLFKDGAHPNAEGAGIIAKEVGEYVAQVAHIVCVIRPEEEFLI